MEIEAKIPRSETNKWGGTALQTLLMTATLTEEQMRNLRGRVEEDFYRAMNAAFEAGVAFGRKNPSKSPSP